MIAKSVKRSVMRLAKGVMVAVMLLVVFVSVALLWERRAFHLDKYIEVDPKEMLVHLEKIFDIDFPEDIKEVKAAKTTPSWDGASSFILKFIGEPNTVDRFLETFSEKSHFEAYCPDIDLRGLGIPRKPLWFTSTIRKGRLGSGSLVGPENFYSASIFIDTTNETNLVVYIESLYESDLDK